jgi:hypothetical protein
MSRFQDRLLMSIHGIAPEDLTRPERPAAWSIRDVIAHLADVELLTAMRMRTILVEETPLLPVIAQEQWVRLHRETVEDLLEDLWLNQRRNAALFESLTADERNRRGRHPKYGVMTIEQLLQSNDDHKEKHLGQIERIKSALGLKASGTFDVAGVTSAHVDVSPQRSPGPGIRVRDLWRRGVRHALLVEIDPGAAWPFVDHHVPGPEEVYVISGELGDGANTYPAGTFLHHPAGSSHIPQSRSGCTLFVYYPEG